MNLPLSSKVTAMPRSPIREVMALANALPDVIHFEVGEPLEQTPAGIIEAAAAAARAGATKYVPNSGDIALRRLIAERVSDRTGRAIDPKRVIVTTGAVGALFTAVAASVEEGHELLVPDPGWPNYYAIGTLAGAQCIPYTLYPERGFEPDLVELERLITPTTRAILVNSPGNPTGAVLSADTIAAIADMAQRHKLFVISDEIYEDMIFEDRHASFANCDIDDQVWIISGCSKSFAMTGWRIGWVVAPAYAVDAAVGLQEPLVSCVAAPSQAAAIAALGSFAEFPAQLCRTYRRRRDIVVEELGNSGLLATVPQGGFYALLDIGGFGIGSTEAATSLIRDFKVALVPGRAFGPLSDRYLRLAFTTSDDDLREGCRRIKAWAGPRLAARGSL